MPFEISNNNGYNCLFLVAVVVMSFMNANQESILCISSCHLMIDINILFKTENEEENLKNKI